MDTKARVIAFYLPQFHPIKENNEWWGNGFTEWTNVGKAKPLFKGHYQPHVPADLGYYDLRVPEVREAQAIMAKEHGVEGFCYWHYWFGNGKRLLERPFNEVVESKEPDFPFCLGWANETWSGIWHGQSNKVLIKQEYLGVSDYKAHFYAILDAFKDKRYILVDGRPLFYIYKPSLIPDIAIFFDVWRKLAIENGLKGIYFIANCPKFEDKDEILSLGFDAVNLSRIFDCERLNSNRFQRGIIHRVFKKLRVFDYEKALKYFVGEEEKALNCIPSIYPNWDNSPRSETRGYIFVNSVPRLFRKHIRQVFDVINHKPHDKKLVFLKSWNEWAEGNYMEPDLKYGRKYLEVLNEELNRNED
jgi:hypothetical protein